MIIESIINRPYSKWLEGSGPHSDIVISSRVRLARNLLEVPFPHQMTEDQAQEVVKAVARVAEKIEVRENLGTMEIVMLNDLSSLDRQILVEKHLISPGHAENTARGRGLVIRDDEAVSIMVNEEDHLRLQCLFSGLQVKEAWELANQADDYLESSLNYAFDEKWGYLTVCPTNVGTGMRASVMLHLPALVMTNQAQRVLATLSQIGLAVRGLYGEGTEATGNLFQISNQVTLGPQEEEIVNNLTTVTGHLIEQEQKARQHLLSKARLSLENRICRALGILLNARIMNSEEALSHLSDVRLGLNLGIIDTTNLRALNEIMVLIQPGYLQKLAGQEMSAFDRDVKRANIIREKLKANQ